MKLLTCKILAYVATAILSGCVLAQLVFSGIYYDKFDGVAHIIGHYFKYPAMFLMYFSLTIGIMNVIGLMAIVFNAYGMMVLYNVVLGVCFLVSLIFGYIHAQTASNDNSRYTYK